MILLDPVNSITSIKFYKKISTQGLGRSAAYLAYIALVFSVVATFALKLKLGPFIDETFVWLERSVPTMTFENGKLSSPLTAPLTIRHPEDDDIAVTIDTTRTDPVTVEMMDQQKVMAYVTQNAFYMMRSPDRLETYDLSKTATPKPVTIDADFYRAAGAVVQRVLYPVALVVIFLIFLVWKALSSLFYSLLALAIDAISGAGLHYKSLLNISLYAQTLLIVLQMIFLFLPIALPAPILVAPLVTGVYIWLAVKKTVLPETAA
jgi:hypothetical protein